MDLDPLYNSSRNPVHHIAWTLYFGFSVKVKDVRQTCGNKLCVRLEHLEAEAMPEIVLGPMVSAQKAFDACYEQVRRFRASVGKMSAVYEDVPSRGGRRPVGNTGAEYIADFQVCGLRALKRWPKRAELFKLYFVRNESRDDVRSALKITEGTLNWWHVEIKKAVGRELRKSPLYPPSQYRLRTVREDEANG